LTNNAVQKNAENYGKFEDGNQLSFYDLQDILNEENSSFNPNYVRDDMIPKMKEIIIHNLESVRKKLKIPTNSRG
jgi:tubulin--tyrosine ligase